MEIKENLKIGRFMTFSPDKGRNRYNWVYYKEAFSKELLEYIFKISEVKNKEIFDPFCGIGTTLLYGWENGINTIGYDANPLSVFISRVKTIDYKEEDVEKIKEHVEKIEKMLIEKKGKQCVEAIKKFRKIRKFMLFDARKIMKKWVIKEIYLIREYIKNIQEQKSHDLLLLGLISILSEISLIRKDGGVLKIIRKNTPSPKYIFKKRMKKIIKSLIVENKKKGKIKIYNKNSIYEEHPKDINLIITSPPYLNNINYLKLYSTELDVFIWDEYGFSKQEIEEKMMASYIKKRSKELMNDNEILNICEKIKQYNLDKGKKSQGFPEIIYEYFYQTKMLFDKFSKMKKGSEIYYIVSNSVLKNYEILVDEICADMLEKRGFEVEIIVGLKRKGKVNDGIVVIRESMIKAKKIK